MPEVAKRGVAPRFAASFALRRTTSCRVQAGYSLRAGCYASARFRFAMASSISAVFL